MRFSARKLDKKDFFGKSGKNFSRRSFRGTYIFTIDPYLVISKSKEDGSWVKVHQTEVIMKVGLFSNIPSNSRQNFESIDIHIIFRKLDAFRG